MRFSLLFLFLCMASAPCRGQGRHFLCSGGFGYFSSQFHTGVTVTVSASETRGFANHACDASIRWGDHLLPVVRGAWKVDIDVLGADLGLGPPVVAFQIRKSDLDSSVTYQIYSLRKPPRLLRTITGGDYYRAQDLSLDDRVAIWTNDAQAESGFENLPLYSFDYLPTVVLRYEKGRLTDVSSEYQAYYDRWIALIKAQLKPEALTEFRNSDGKLSSPPSMSNQNLHTLLRTKIKVLEIVWAYLYSGRQREAWTALANMWPPADFTRIREAIQDAQSRGILRQVAQIEKPRPASRKKRRAMIYDMRTLTRQMDVSSIMTSSTDGDLPGMPASSGGQDQGALPMKIKPQPIYLSSPEPKNNASELPTSEIDFNLVIDAAGKVRSAKLINRMDAGPAADTLIRASKDWKFIPGFRAGRPVACQIEFGVSPYQ